MTMHRDLLGERIPTTQGLWSVICVSDLDEAVTVERTDTQERRTVAGNVVREWLDVARVCGEAW